MRTKPRPQLLSKTISDDFQNLILPGNLGFYNQCEVSTIFLYSKALKKVYNYFTLIVFEEAHFLSSSEEFLTKGNVKLNNDYSFGIIRHYKTIPEIAAMFQNLLTNNIWQHNDKILEIPSYRSIPKQFISASEKIPLNSILKNNYKTGSYILEFFDENKYLSSEHHLNHNEIEKIAEIVKKNIPLDLQFINDRVSNIIFQFPIEICYINYRLTQAIDKINLSIAWHPKITTPPDLEIKFSSELDGSILSYSLNETNQKSEYLLRAPNTDGEGSINIVNNQNHLLLYSSLSHFIKRFGINMFLGSQHSEPRIFNGNSIKLVSKSSDTKSYHDYVSIILDRKYDSEKEKLSETLELVQYGISNKINPIGDIRKLIDKHGENGVYLWDPFLDSNDILNTLYYCKYSNVPLRTISSFSRNTRPIIDHSNKIFKFYERINISSYYKYTRKNVNEFIRDSLSKYYNFKLVPLGYSTSPEKLKIIENEFFEYSFTRWKAEQASSFINSGNNLGLDLEYRCQYKMNGYQFHDRFLIFPNEERKPLAWSLGTSINSYGKDHHILQKVSNPMIIQKAFEQLWNQLSNNDCLVWKSK